MSDDTNSSAASAAPPAEVARALGCFAHVTWPVAAHDVPALIRTLGWSLTDGADEAYVEATTGWPISRNEASFSSDDGQLTKISFRITDVVRDDPSWRADFMNDAFAAAVQAVADVLGKPSRTSRGAEPSAEWELPNNGRATVRGIGSSVTVSVISAEWAEVNRRIGA